MKHLIYTALMILSIGLVSCQSTQQETPEAKKDTTSAMVTDSTEKHFDTSMVDNKKDPTCGMPTTAGIHDTIHYENHVLGFCSSECKSEFLKNPKAGLAAAELAK